MENEGNYDYFTYQEVERPRYFKPRYDVKFTFMWPTPIPSAKSLKLQKLLPYLAVDAILVPTKTWYHVTDLKNRKSWGFAVQDGVVVDAPYDYYSLIGREYKENENPNLIVSKVAEQCLT